ncbi:MAG: efflux RND transporter periplasmic adaptor subunit [Nitrospinota bacterium]
MKNYIRKLNRNRCASLCLVLLIFTSCFPAEKEKPTVEKKDFSLPVQIGKVVYMNLADEVRAFGNIESGQELAVSPEIKGRVAMVLVEKGHKVKAGDLIAQIDPGDYELVLEKLYADFSSSEEEFKKAREGLRQEEKERLEAQTRAAQSSLKLAKVELKRTKNLVERKVLPQSELDDAEDKIRQASETLKASQAEQAAGMTSRVEEIEKLGSEIDAIRKQIEVAENNLSKVDVLAPFDGVIITKEIDQGAIVSPGTVIVSMISSSRFKAVLEIPQGYRNKLNKLRKADFFVKELGLRFKYSKNLKRMIRVIPDSKIFSGNIKVQIDLQNPDSSLYSGLTLESKLSFGVRKNVLNVPAISLVKTEKGTVVYIVKNKKAHPVPVKVFQEHDGFVEIKDTTRQLNADAKLIMRGSGAVFPEATVFITNPESGMETPLNSASKDSGMEKPKASAKNPKS